MKNFVILVMFVILFTNLYANSESIGEIEIQVKKWDGDLLDPSEISVLVYQNGNSLFRNIQLETNPQIISELPLGQKYSFEVIRHDMNYLITNKVTLDSVLKKIELKIPSEGGMKFNVYYKDGNTPINNAQVTIKSPNQNELVSTTTNSDGQTPRYWLQSTTDDKSYQVEVSLGDSISYLQSPIKNSPDVSRDFKIITPWPSVLDERITVSLDKDIDGENMSYDNFKIELYDKNNKKVSESALNLRGEANFSNLPVGEYVFKALVKSVDSELGFIEWGETKVSLIGDQNIVKINEGYSNESNCNCVAFRFDDVQDYFLNQVQTGLFQSFKDKDAPLTIGVIGGLIGMDSILVDHIKENLNSKNSKLEIASHSWNNVPLITMSKEKQNSMIQLTNEAIDKTFNVLPTVFIPPENVFNEDTINVLKENNFSHLSSSIQHDQPPYPFEDSSLYRFPQAAQTAILDEKSNLWIVENRTKIFNDIAISMDENGFAVVMMHPPDFAINDNGIYRNELNNEYISELGLLIDDIRNSGMKIVPISQINSDEKSIVKSSGTSPSFENCNCVAFSLAGIQDYWLNDVQLEILNTFTKTKTDFTVGVIAKYFGEDEKLLSFFSSTLNDKSTEMEVANNGWEYEDFSKLDLNEQISLIKKSNDKISSVLGVQPVTFLPPLDSTNEVTPIALERNSITYVSSNMLNDPAPYNFEDLSYSRIPFGTTTGIYDSESESFKGISHKESFSKIKEDIKNYDFAVVRIYPQEFSVMENGEEQNIVNSQQIRELELLIEEINKNGYRTVPIYKIPSIMSTNAIEIPDWIKNNALWWSNDQISETDFVSGVEYMIQNRIILIPQIPQSESNQSSEVPSWIKNNAGWWAQELITDEDFVSGLEYLIKNGIITI